MPPTSSVTSTRARWLTCRITPSGATLEALDVHLDRVGPGREERRGIAAGLVGHVAVDGPLVDRSNRHVCAGDDAVQVVDGPDDGAGGDLGGGRRDEHRQESKEGRKQPDALKHGSPREEKRRRAASLSSGWEVVNTFACVRAVARSAEIGFAGSRLAATSSLPAPQREARRRAKAGTINPYDSHPALLHFCSSPPARGTRGAAGTVGGGPRRTLARRLRRPDPHRPRLIVVQGGRSRASAASAPAGAQASTSATSRLPGLLDAHTHLTYDIDADWVTRPCASCRRTRLFTGRPHRAPDARGRLHDRARRRCRAASPTSR